MEIQTKENLRETPPEEGRERHKSGPVDPMGAIIDRVRQITRENERLFQQLIAGERRFRGLAKAVWSVQEEERRRLARELHDGLGQTLTALKHQLELLQREATELTEPVQARLADSVELAAQSLNETRELSRLLRPQILDDLGLAAALSWLTRTVQQRTGLPVTFESHGLEERLDPDLETLAFRVIQEALNNVVKHGDAAQARVEVAVGDGRLVVEVIDAGCGFDAGEVLAAHDGSSGSGLRGIRDRVELFAGRLEIETAPGEGTRLHVEIPLGEAS